MDLPFSKCQRTGLDSSQQTLLQNAIAWLKQAQVMRNVEFYGIGGWMLWRHLFAVQHFLFCQSHSKAIITVPKALTRMWWIASGHHQQPMGGKMCPIFPKKNWHQLEPWSWFTEQHWYDTLSRALGKQSQVHNPMIKWTIVLARPLV